MRARKITYVVRINISESMSVRNGMEENKQDKARKAKEGSSLKREKLIN